MSITANFNRIHWLSSAIGGALALAGVAVILAPSIATAVPLTSVLTWPVAIVAISLGLWRARVRNSKGVDHLELPVPELPFANPTPGDDLDEMVYRYTRRGEATIEYPKRVGERLREVAIEAIAHREECTRDEALDMLADGSWTDNRYAAAYFSETVGTPEPSLEERVSRLLGRGENEYERQVRETVDAIVDVAELVSDADATAARTDESAEDESLLDRLLGGGPDDSSDAVGSHRKSVIEYEDEDDGQRVAEGVRYYDAVDTRRWLGVEAFALVALGVGVVTLQPAPLLAAGVAAAYAAYARTGDAPEMRTLSVERDIDEPSPAPGEEVQVTVTVTNDGGAFMSDLRLVDLVPPNFRVVDGSPRLYTALRPGAQVRFQYTVVAERGTHEWPLLAVGSGFAGTVEREAVYDVDTTIECLPRLRTVTDVPVRNQTTVYSGQVDTNIGGAGLEFHSVREYRPNDPMRRVEWKRRARTGELATIDFREERAATMLLLFDAREGSYVSDGPGSRHALDRSVAAASDVYTALADDGHLVGLAAFDTVPCFLAPSAGNGHDEAARRLIAHHPALASLPPDMLDLEGGYVDPMSHIRRQLPSNSQIIMFSPLVSDYAADVARRLDSAGNRVTIISPDPTATETPGQRLARVERAVRINRLREWGVRIVNWEADEPLRLGLEKASRRASA